MHSILKMSIVHKYILTIIWNIVTMAKKVSYTIINRKGDVEKVTEIKGQKERKQVPLSGELMNLGFYLAAPMLLGILLGKWLDSYFETGNRFTLGLIILGLFATFYNLFKIVKDATDKTDR
jgi:F0F1-type ATP synthase assembly protein I